MGAGKSSESAESVVESASMGSGESLVLHPKDLFADHELVRLAGHGAMAEVWLAFDPYLQRQHAIKLMRHELLKDESAIERFYQEARAVAKLNHPNIVQIHRVGQERNVPFLVMEWIDGESLLEKLNREGALPFLTAYDIIVQVIDGLSYACDMGIVHRDIKPNNIMIECPSAQQQEKRSRVRIADFGLAMGLGGEAGTGAKSLGSPGYMSPEAVLGEEQDHRSDIYSLGIMFYHMLTGQIPYITLDRAEMMRMQVTQPLPEPKALRKLMGGAVLELLRRMTAKDPGERFGTYEALRAALEAVAASANRRRLADGSPSVVQQQPALPPPAEAVIDTVKDAAAAEQARQSLERLAASRPRRANWTRLLVVLVLVGCALPVWWWVSKRYARPEEGPSRQLSGVHEPTPTPLPAPVSVAAPAASPTPQALVAPAAADAPSGSNPGALIRAAYEDRRQKTSAIAGASPTPMSSAARNVLRAAAATPFPAISEGEQDFIIESRREGRNSERYCEIDGVWVDCSTSVRAAKSLAEGCSQPDVCGSRKAVFRQTGDPHPTAQQPAAALFMPFLSRAGHYHVYATWPQAANAAPVYYTIRHALGDTRKVFVQNGSGAGMAPNADQWVWLGEYDFRAGPDQFVEVRIKQDARPLDGSSPGQVFADAVRFRQQPLARPSSSRH